VPYPETGYLWIHVTNADKQLLRRRYREEGGVCRLCQREARGISMVLDHDHKTGLTRGFVCQSCNISIGHAEGPSAAEYLKRYAELAALLGPYIAATAWVAGEEPKALEERGERRREGAGHYKKRVSVPYYGLISVG